MIVPCFLAGAAAALALSLACVLLVRPHLGPLLVELCHSAARAHYWRTTLALVLFLVGVLAGTGIGGYPASGEASEQQLFLGLVGQVRGSLAGLLAGLVVVSGLILYAIAAFERRGTLARLADGASE